MLLKQIARWKHGAAVQGKKQPGLAFGICALLECATSLTWKRSGVARSETWEWDLAPTGNHKCHHHNYTLTVDNWNGLFIYSRAKPFLVKKGHMGGICSHENKLWSQKSHPKATVSLMWVNKPEGILCCYTEELVMIVFSQSTFTVLCCPGLFFFFFLWWAIISLIFQLVSSWG